MRIASVAIHLEKTIVYGGVGRKIQTQVQLWQEFGHEARLFLHTPDAIELPEVCVFRYPPSRGPAPVRLLSREWQRSQALRRLIQAVAKFQPDLIYLRYGMFAFPLQDLFQVAPVVVEINTNDVDEYRYRGWLYYGLNRLTRRQTLGRAAGLVYLSRELARLPSNQHWHKPSVVISNGVDFNHYTPLPAPQNARPCLGFVATGYQWHGVEKLTGLARRYPELDIEVIGYNPSDIPDAPSNMHFHGYLPQNAVREILGRVDVVCGSLALHRNRMNEASPLKVREALGLGIPVIIGYSDTDLSGTSLEFVLEVPNREDNVETHADQMMSFIRSMQGKRAERQLLIPLIDQRVKEEQRLAFFSQIVRNNPIGS